MFTYLYFKELNIDPNYPEKIDRDRFVLSKGHTAPGLYEALAYRGFFPVGGLPTLRHIDSYLQGHSNMGAVPGVDMSTGLLGQGVSCAAGLPTTGLVPFASSFAMFAAGRAFEQVRNSIGYPHLNVKVGAAHEHNCLTLCFGSLNANADNNVADTVRKHCDRIAFVHIRKRLHPQHALDAGFREIKTSHRSI